MVCVSQNTITVKAVIIKSHLAETEAKQEINCQDTSVSIMKGYGMHGQGSVLG
jgi:hypothetical protein